MVNGGIYKYIRALDFNPTLHIHSRLDVCDFCGPSLSIELNRPDGVLQDLRDGLMAYTKQVETPKLLILVSSREELKVDASKRS